MAQLESVYLVCAIACWGIKLTLWSGGSFWNISLVYKFVISYIYLLVCNGIYLIPSQTNVRLGFCDIAVSRRLHLWQIDFVSAFFNSDNTYDIYIEQPKGFEEGRDNHVWKLWKTLYGTMQGAHDWAENLDKTFQGHGYYKSHADPQIWSRIYDDELTLTSIWTNDILGASSTVEGKQLAKSQLGSSYEIKDLGEAKLILSMHIDRNSLGDITLSQCVYCECLLKQFNMDLCSPATTPLPSGLVLSAEDVRRMENSNYSGDKWWPTHRVIQQIIIDSLIGKRDLERSREVRDVAVETKKHRT